MKKVLFFLFIAISFQNFAKAQRVEILYDKWNFDRVLFLNGLNFQQYFPKENVIIIEDSIFVNKIFEVIKNFEKCDSCKILRSTNAQVIFIDDSYGYDIINLFYHTNIPTEFSKFGHMELNGKPVIFNFKLQYVIEEIIKYHNIKGYSNLSSKKFISQMTKKL